LAFARRDASNKDALPIGGSIVIKLPMPSASLAKGSRSGTTTYNSRNWD